MRVCLEKGCPRLVRAGRCQVHQRWNWPSSNGSPAYRGDWPRIRARVLREEPDCRVRLPGCTIVSTDVDHIVPLARGGTHARDNLRGVCHPCHKKITARIRSRAS